MLLTIRSRIVSDLFNGLLKAITLLKTRVEPIFVIRKRTTIAFVFIWFTVKRES